MTDAVSEPRQPPELTHLKVEVHTSDTGARSLTVSFLVNVRQTLHEEFDAMVTDAVLLHAHSRGHMPVGPLFYTVEPWQPEEQGALTEGKTMSQGIEEMSLQAEARAGNICQVSADLELGLSLD